MKFRLVEKNGEYFLQKKYSGMFDKFITFDWKNTMIVDFKRESVIIEPIYNLTKISFHKKEDGEYVYSFLSENGFLNKRCLEKILNKKLKYAEVLHTKY